jgi:ectoine hydroxylase-related dioxygenase (phytanoyl-CoA dioxygenase family)
LAHELAPSAKVTQAHIDAYRRDGAVLVKDVLSAEALRLLAAGIVEAYLRQTTRTTKVDAERGAGETMVLDYASQESPCVRALLDSGVIGEIGASLMQTPSAHLVLDQIFHKAPGPILATPWHQDTPFLRVRGDDLIRLWFPCDFSPREITVQVVRGSHRWNVVWSTRVDTEEMKPQAGDAGVVGDSWLPAPPDVARYRDSFDILSWDVEPGDVLAFQGNMLHGTDGLVKYDRPRRALAVLLGGPGLRYHAPEGKAFPSPGRVRGLRAKDDFPDGTPIGEYEDAFPTLWRAAEG